MMKARKIIELQTMGDETNTKTAAARFRAEKAAADRDKHELVLLSQIHEAGLPEPQRNYRFAAENVGWTAGRHAGKGEQRLRERLASSGIMGLEDWRFDFAWPDLMLAVEIEGGIWMKTKSGSRGRHQTPMGFSKDCKKYREGTAIGWTIFRFTGGEVQNNTAIIFLSRWFFDLEGKEVNIWSSR